MTHTESTHTATQVDGLARWTAVGNSTAEDSFTAGLEAAEVASVNAEATLFVVFAGHERDHEALLAGVASVAGPEASIIGCSSGGEIALGGPTDNGVVVMAIGGPGISVATRCADVVGGDLRTAGEQVADALWDIPDRGHTVLLLLSDGLAGDQQEVVRGAYATAGATIPLVGGCAAAGIDAEHTVLFQATRDGSRIGGGQVIGAAISSTAPIGIGVHHGWDTSEEEVLVTRASGNVIYEIDDAPALDGYLRLHDATELADADAETLTQFASTHPIGISRRSGEEVRFVSSVDPEQRTISTIASIPQGALVRAMTGTMSSVLAATDVACAQALDQLDGPALGVLAFDCVARRGVMGDEGILDEVKRIEDRVAAPIAGFYTYGEFARVAGASGFHNQTLVTLAFG